MAYYVNHGSLNNESLTQFIHPEKCSGFEGSRPYVAFSVAGPLVMAGACGGGEELTLQ